MHEVILEGQVISYNFVYYGDPHTSCTLMRSNANLSSYIRITQTSNHPYKKQDWNIIYFTLN